MDYVHLRGVEIIHQIQHIFRVSARKQKVTGYIPNVETIEKHFQRITSLWAYLYCLNYTCSCTCVYYIYTHFAYCFLSRVILFVTLCCLTQILKMQTLIFCQMSNYYFLLSWTKCSKESTYMYQCWSFTCTILHCCKCIYDLKIAYSKLRVGIEPGASRFKIQQSTEWATEISFAVLVVVLINPNH